MSTSIVSAKRSLITATLVAGFLVASSVVAAPGGAGQAVTQDAAGAIGPTIGQAVAFDVSPPLSAIGSSTFAAGSVQLPPERGPMKRSSAFTGDEAVQSAAVPAASAVSPPLLTFEGVGNRDNPFPVSPPDPVGDVGPNHYVEMTNLVFAIYSKTGARLFGPKPIGDLWRGFAVSDCEDLSGDPIVLHDQLADRWILTQFTTRGPTYYNCVAVSRTPDPTQGYYRYAFSSGPNFPDYPKYGVWPNAYFLSTREFAPDDSFAGVGAYALERARMIAGDPAARFVRFLLPPRSKPYLPGDGLLPTDLDGSRLPPAGSPNWFVGTMDNGGPYGAPFDGINVFEFRVTFGATPSGSFGLTKQIPVARFDSIFPCDPASPRDCIPQPDTDNRLDILSYRQRPIWRLAYRNFGGYASMVTNQSVEARPAIGGTRWYELRVQAGGQPGLYQEGTYAPNDGIHRWMGSVAMDENGNMALGYSVSSSTVYPGIRYTGRLRGDPLGQLRGEAVLINGSGSQLESSRWGDYSSMNVDPTDDCSFWYVNEYYARTSDVGWRTRIGKFRLAGCG